MGGLGKGGSVARAREEAEEVAGAWLLAQTWSVWRWWESLLG